MSINKNSILIGVAVLAVIATGVLALSSNSSSVLSFLKFNSGMSAEAISKKSIDYLNTSVLQGQTATLESYSEESGVVKFTIKIADKTYDSYATKDGKLLFPEAFDLSKKSINPISQNQNNQQVNQNTQDSAPKEEETPDVKPADIKKVDKPSLDVFVVSRCPFGLQIQRAIAEAVKGIPSLAEFIKVRYIGDIYGDTITAMHGEEEATENFRQICIREEQKSKYWSYVTCQMKSGDTAGCEKSTGVDSKKLASCLKDSNRGLAYAKEDFALNVKYNIKGSPTLVLNATGNGQQISEFRDFGGRSAEVIKNIICISSLKEPSFCSIKLNTEQAVTSFSSTYEQKSK